MNSWLLDLPLILSLPLLCSALLSSALQSIAVQSLAEQSRAELIIAEKRSREDQNSAKQCMNS